MDLGTGFQKLDTRHKAERRPDVLKTSSEAPYSKRRATDADPEQGDGDGVMLGFAISAAFAIGLLILAGYVGLRVLG
jgi:hypothetical protein